MTVYHLDPLGDPRWTAFVDRHPRASVFHTTGWLQALRDTYGYEPFVLTTSPPGKELASGVPFCRVNSWFGRRLVSLPFSDHCEPLVDRTDDAQQIAAALGQEVVSGGWKYAEIRPRPGSLSCRGEDAARQTVSYRYHVLDLTPPIGQVVAGLHPSCIRRAVRRADREGLSYESGSSPALLGAFYRLLRATRRRHAVPPPPIAWFRNLVQRMGERVTIRVASKDRQPVAAILTLAFRDMLVYKYGCSEAARHSLGGMPFLFWHAIHEAKTQGFRALDLGRSDDDQPGLIAFKSRLGAASSTLTYYRYATVPHQMPAAGWRLRAARRLFARLPDPAFGMAGRLLYRHFG